MFSLKKMFFNIFIVIFQQMLVFSIKNGEMIKIWPGHAPGSEHVKIKETVIERSKKRSVKDRAVEKILEPSLTVYLPKKPNGSAIVIAPGGSYERIVIDKEADELKSWLNGLGVTFFVLRYRLPGDGHQNRSDVSVQDAQRAIRLIRYRAKEWGLDPNRIGLMGFSAGGHVASGLAVKYKRALYQPIDEIDNVSARPDFLILGYPVITMKEPFVHGGSRRQLLGKEPDDDQINACSHELLVNEETPKTFIFHADDDRDVSVNNTLLFYQALHEKRVPVEMHIFMKGGHGFSIRYTKNKPVRHWTLLCGEWLKSLEVVNKK